MDEKPKRACPECGSEKYLFRGRKTIPAENGTPAMVETKYRCKACEQVWKELEPVKEKNVGRLFAKPRDPLWYLCVSLRTIKLPRGFHLPEGSVIIWGGIRQSCVRDEVEK